VTAEGLDLFLLLAVVLIRDKWKRRWLAGNKKRGTAV